MRRPVSDPTCYADIVRRFVRDRDFRVATGNAATLHSCLLIAPHGGATEPGTSELLQHVVPLGPWAWYECTGLLRSGNREAFHLTSTAFDEPVLAELLAQTSFV